MKILFQVIKNYASQEVAAVVVTTANKKYYFNVPETFQRFMKNNHIKLNPSNAIFLTRLKTPTICGLFGQMLTMFESKAAIDTTILGPKGTTQFFDRIRFKMGYKILPFAFIDVTDPTTEFLYGFRKFETIQSTVLDPLYPDFFYQMNKYIEETYKKDTSQFADEINDPKQFFQKDSSFFKDDACEIFPIQQTGNVLSYAFVSNKIQGKILKDRLQAFGVKGKQISILIERGELTLDNGKTVKASDVQEESLPSTVILIVDCLNLEQFEDFSKNPIVQSLLASNIDPKEQSVVSVIHLGEYHLVTDDGYQSFFSLFEKSCQHIFTCKELREENIPEKEITLLNTNFSHFAFVNVLNQALPKHFPCLQTSEDIYKHSPYDVKTVFPKLENPTVAKRFYDFYLQPLKSQGYFPVYPQPAREFLVTEEIIAKLSSTPTKDPLDLETDPITSITTSKTSLKIDFTEYNPEVVFLGTGSMKPAAYRNVSAVYVRNDKNNHGMLFDSGEGTYYQLLNQYGETKLLEEILPNLRIIFISHIHSDHHLGILNVLRQAHIAQQNKGIAEDIFLVVPFNMVPWIETYSEMVEDLKCRIVFNQELTAFGDSFSEVIGQSLFGSMSKESLEYYEHPKQNEFVQKLRMKRQTDRDLFGKYLKEQNIVQFETVPVDHCPQSYALVVAAKNGVKIVYSGDLRPSDQLCQIGKNATLFIHEATFNDDLEENAKKNMHSTVKEAALSAIKANAWRLVLTHFSQRYQKVVLQKGAPTTERINTEEGELTKESAVVILSDEDKEYYAYLESSSVLAFDHLSAYCAEFENLPFKTRIAQDLFPNDPKAE